MSVFVNKRQFLNAMLLNDRLSLGQSCVFVAGYKWSLRHEVTHRTQEIGRLAKTNVAIGQNTDEHSSVINNWHTRKLESTHQIFGFLQ